MERLPFLCTACCTCYICGSGFLLLYSIGKRLNSIPLLSRQLPLLTFLVPHSKTYSSSHNYHSQLRATSEVYTKATIPQPHHSNPATTQQRCLPRASCPHISPSSLLLRGKKSGIPSSQDRRPPPAVSTAPRPTSSAPHPPWAQMMASALWTATAATRRPLHSREQLQTRAGNGGAGRLRCMPRSPELSAAVRPFRARPHTARNHNEQHKHYP